MVGQRENTRQKDKQMRKANTSRRALRLERFYRRRSGDGIRKVGDGGWSQEFCAIWNEWEWELKGQGVNRG